jgi:hypothetical protein
MPIQMRSLLVIFVILLAGASFQARVGAQAGNPSAPDIRGIYLYSLNTVVDKFPANSPQVTHALSEPGVDGFTLVENWSSVEPERGVFEWDKLPDGQQGHFDQWVHAAVSAGRKINLAIRAGQDTPCWMFDLASQPCGPGYLGSYAGAREFTFVAASHQGQTQHPCEVVSMAAPWDPVFLREWDAMLAGVAAHLRAIGAYGSVALVRQTGVNRTTDEFRLPEEILPQPCTDANGIVHQNTNAISTWLAAGYRPWLLFLAWDAIDASFQRNFPGKTFNVPIIPIDTGRGQYPFPEIDARGCVYTAIVPKSSWTVPPAIPANTCTNNADLDTAKSQLKTVLSSFLWLSDVNAFGRLVVEFENLDTAEPASPTVVEASDELHSMMGFMTNNFVAAASSNDPDNDPGNNVGAACSGGFVQPVACGSDAEYLSLLEIGIYPCRNAPSDAFCRSATVQSAFIEVFAPDVVQFPSAICQAHNELLTTPQSP